VFRYWISGPYTLDIETKWNPGSRLLASTLGPEGLVETVDGSPAWDVLNLEWYLSQDPSRDIPYLIILLNQPKDGNHGAEFGWQDDPRGPAALQKHRQPFVCSWNSGSVSRELLEVVGRSSYGRAAIPGTLEWGNSVPAFSYCSLNNNPGNGDPDSGDPWGQMNGFLLWQGHDIVDEKDSWEMTVFVTGDSPEPVCTVDLTPRHCRKFKPRAGQKFRWANTDLGTGKRIASGTVSADQWGLVTLEKLVVSRNRNRITIAHMALR
jgi:hypothetical protein